MKKILVCIKRVPDYASKLVLSSDAKDYERSNLKYIMNPFDEIAVEEAVRLKEKDSSIEIVVATIGQESSTEQLRSALAIGGDRGILIKTESAVDSYRANLVFEKIFHQEKPDLVIMGKQAIDTDSNQTGQLLASKLSIHQATFASKIDIIKEENQLKARVIREADGGLQTVEVNLPAVITTDLRLNNPRYPTAPMVIKSKKKQIDTVNIDELGVAQENMVEVVGYQYPEKRKSGIKVSTAAELFEKLKNEAKVL